MKEFEQVIKISPQGDAYDDIRMEYANMLKKQLARGNNGLVKTKYITFPLKRKISGKQNRSWSVSNPIS